MGFGEKTAENLVASMNESKKTPTEDARFLSGFGIRHLGIGDSRKILSHYKLTEIKNLSAEDIAALPGFAEKTGTEIADGIARTWPTIEHMMGLYTALEETKGAVVDSNSPISGKVVMFTGAMEDDRDEMKAEAKDLGARVLSSVSGKLEILIIGKKASASKIAKAKKVDAQVLTEAEYRTLLNKK
jgi:DNA ligase (NAD+)